MTTRAGPLLLMRRRSHVLVLVVGAAAALLLSAPALSAPPPWLTNELAAPAAPGIQHSPAIAVNPAAPGQAFVVADNGAGGQTSPLASTTAGATLDWTTSWNPSGPLQYSGFASAGQPDTAWGPGQTVYVAELGSTTGHSLCSSSAGILVSESADGGATFSPSDPASPIDTGSSGAPSSELIEPAIATSGTNVYVVYTELKWSGANCSGTPDSASILLASSSDSGSSFSTARRVSPLGISSRYRSPSVAPLPDGRIVVAFRDDSAPSPQIETETCSPFASPLGNYCGVSSGLVGPSTLVGDATAPSLVSGVVGPPTPSVIAAGGRVVVAWHAASDANVHVFAAMSTTNGASYGPAQRIDAAGVGNQVAPELAATASGRVDVAYLLDTGFGVQATTASANPPLPGATTEAWAQPVVVQGAPASAVSGIPGQLAPLGRRIGVATAAVAASPLPATVVAFTATAAGDQDVHVAGLLHGATAPAIASQVVTASKNVQTVVRVTGSDDDGDPLTWSTGAQPTTPGSSVAVADAARGDFSFTAANQKGTDTFEAVATDGVPGHEARQIINVNVVNDPPEIICPSLVARENTPLEIPIADCVRDHNGDPITVDLHDAIGGTVERSSGTWLFIPTAKSTATGSFVLAASDGDLTTEAVVRVTIATAIGRVNFVVTDAARRRAIAQGASLRFAGTAVDTQGQEFRVAWNFGDGSPGTSGRNVSHRFRRNGAFTVKATAPGASPIQIKVLVRKRAVELTAPPAVFDGVMRIRVRTRVAGKLFVRVDSRSRTITVPAATTETEVSLQVTTGPMVRLSLRLRPSKATKLPALSLRRVVLVSPLSAG